jgi:hypothetical protein
MFPGAMPVEADTQMSFLLMVECIPLYGYTVSPLIHGFITRDFDQVKPNGDKIIKRNFKDEHFKPPRMPPAAQWMRTNSGPRDHQLC